MDYQSLIKHIRETLIISQVELAQILGVSYSTVNRWEMGHHKPTIKVKRKIAKLCVDYDIYLEENKNGE